MNMRLLLFGLLLVLLAGDVATTTYALQEAGCREGNPVAAVFVGSPTLHLLIKLSFAGVVLLLARTDSNHRFRANKAAREQNRSIGI